MERRRLIATGLALGAALGLSGAARSRKRQRPIQRHDLVLVHGGGVSAHLWDGTVALLNSAANNPFGRILQLDIPGCGSKQGMDTSRMSRRDVARSLNDEVRSAGFTKPILVCHSAGNFLMPDMVLDGAYSQVCNLEGPVLLAGELGGGIFGKGLIGSDPAYVGNPVDPAKVSAYELRHAQFCRDLPQEECDRYVAESLKEVIPRSLMNEPAIALRPEQLPPAAYIIARRSTVFPVEWQRRYAARLGPKVRIAEIEADHLAPKTRPGLVASALLGLYAK